MKIEDTLTATQVMESRAVQAFKSGRVGFIEVEFDPYDGKYTVVDKYIKEPCEISQKIFEEAVSKSSILNFEIAVKIVKALSKNGSKNSVRGVKCH